jgi:hypothetical protein
VSTLIDNTAGFTLTEGLLDFVISGNSGMYDSIVSNAVDGVEYAYKAKFSDGVTAGYESGKGVYSSATSSIARTTIFTSSNSGAKVDFAAGQKFVALVTDKETIENLAATAVNAVASTATDSLYDYTGTSNGDQASVAGYYVPGDGGGGMFYWNSTSTAADDGGVTILPTGHTGAGRWRRIVNEIVGVKFFGAKGDGSTDDTANIQAALDSGFDLTFAAGVYMCAGLTVSTDFQRLSSSEAAFLKKNANGNLLSGGANYLKIEGLAFNGSGATYTGDNISVTGTGFIFNGSSSNFAAGRAIKSTGGHTMITNTIDNIATLGSGATDYDIELGVSGTASLYHRIDNWYSGHSGGGILLIDTGSHFLSNSQFGKLTIQAGTKPAGVNGGNTVGCRITGAIVVEQSTALFAANTPSNSLYFALGTSAGSWDASNSSPSAVTNDGNANTYIQRQVSTGSTIELAYFDDSASANFIIDNTGKYTVPNTINMPNNTGIKIKDTAGALKTAILLNSGDDWTIGGDTGANFMSIISGSSGIYLAPSNASAYQAIASTFRPQLDGVPNLGSGSQRFNTLYATNGTINTSDEREKQDIDDLSDVLLDAWGDVPIVSYRWKAKVAAEGEGARIHIGRIAQNIIDTFSAHGLDATRYSLLCHDEWAEHEILISGNTIETDNETGEDTITPAVYRTIPAGDRYGVRYAEAAQLEAAWQRRRMDRLEALLG